MFNRMWCNCIPCRGLNSVLFQANYNAEPPATGTSTKLDDVQGQVNEVKVILKDNINKVLERGDRLDDLMEKTDGLQASVSTPRCCLCTCRILLCHRVQCVTDDSWFAFCRRTHSRGRPLASPGSTGGKTSRWWSSSAWSCSSSSSSSFCLLPKSYEGNLFLSKKVIHQKV